VGTAGRLLIVDDDRYILELLETFVVARGYEAVCHEEGQGALTALSGGTFDALIVDLLMSGMDGIELCERAQVEQPGLPVIILTGHGCMESAVAALRVGAFDFITKPVDLDLLLETVQRAVHARTARAEVRRLREASRLGSGRTRAYEMLIGESAPMLALYDLLDRVASTDASVLISGETGTGKELVARAIHRRGRRERGPFVAVDCSAMPEHLLESELFGHVRGAFTDARSSHPGLLVHAEGGTLLLDEVGDMPMGLQPKLLRALQERVVRPVGSTHEVPYDVRLVAATHRDLEREVACGRLRRDLFFRINVINIHLPALRQRGKDVLLLAQHFVRHVAQRADKRVEGVSPDAAERLLAYTWPGNVRELQNCVERAVTLTSYDQITVADLPRKIRKARVSGTFAAVEARPELVPMEEVERRHILRVLREVKGNKTLAAQILGFDRRTLYRKLERYEEVVPPE
jgi:two-component system, NtrC family, response regulator AtoC